MTSRPLVKQRVHSRRLRNQGLGLAGHVSFYRGGDRPIRRRFPSDSIAHGKQILTPPIADASLELDRAERPWSNWQGRDLFLWLPLNHVCIIFDSLQLGARALKADYER